MSRERQNNGLAINALQGEVVAAQVFRPAFVLISWFPLGGSLLGAAAESSSVAMGRRSAGLRET